VQKRQIGSKSAENEASAQCYQGHMPVFTDMFKTENINISREFQCGGARMPATKLVGEVAYASASASASFVGVYCSLSCEEHDE
jgi:hypothetical protein